MTRTDSTSQNRAVAFSKNPYALAAASAVGLWLAFPPADRGFLGWVVLAPLFMLLKSPVRFRKLLAASAIGGLIFGVLSMSWVAKADPSGWFWMGLFMALWMPAFLIPARLVVNRLGVPILLGAPVVWVATEYFRSLLLSGFPWYYLAHTQYAYLTVIQISDLAGAWMLSFLVAMVNALIAELALSYTTRAEAPPFRLTRLQLCKVAVVAGLVAASLGYGFVRLSSARFRPGPTVALLQTDFDQDLKNRMDMSEILSRLDSLVSRAAATTPKPDLIVWPETSYPPGLVTIDPTLTESDFHTLTKADYLGWTPEEWRTRQRRANRELQGLADDIRIPMIVGVTTYDFRPKAFLHFNTAELFTPGRVERSRYHKRALVPVGEYMPFLEVLPWLIKLTPYTDGYVPRLSPGSGPAHFVSGGVRYAPIICFEDTIPWVAREAANGSTGFGRTDVLLNITNDGWFRGTPEHQTHLAISVFRAVECRTPIARAVNTGISAVIDGNGRIREAMPIAKEAVLTANVPLDGRSSLYLQVGDSFGIVCLILTIILALLAPFQSRQSAALAQGASVG